LGNLLNVFLNVLQLFDSLLRILIGEPGKPGTSVSAPGPPGPKGGQGAVGSTGAGEEPHALAVLRQFTKVIPNETHSVISTC